MRYYLETFGCSLNKADSDLIVGRLSILSVERTETKDNADVIIMNTCGVKEPTEDKIIHKLEKLSRGQHPVIVTGCLPKISFKRVKRAIPNFGAILGPQSISSLGSIIIRVQSGERGIVQLEPDTDSKLQFFEGPPDSLICTVPLCEGCLGNCAYCAVRFARAELKSYRIDDLHSVVERCVQLGYLEIRLTAQDAGAFGYDTGETLPDLFFNLGRISGNHMFRLGMFNPNLVIDHLSELLDSMETPRFFKFFHIPLQAGNNRVLKSMKRRYSVHEWIEVVESIRKRFSQATIATDIIVGFPGETDSEFQDTVDTILEVRPSVINISKYGDRPGTEASKSQEKVITSLKKERSRNLTRIVDDIVLSSNESWIGWEGSVIITSQAPKDGVLGRNPSYKSVILPSDIPLGTLQKVRIVSAKKTHLVGNII